MPKLILAAASSRLFRSEGPRSVCQESGWAVTIPPVPPEMTAMSRYALGIDAGGSKCDAALMDETGAVVAWGRGGPTVGLYAPPQVIAASYRQAISQALQGIQNAQLWVAGSLPAGEPRQPILAAGSLVSVALASEPEMAFASAQQQWGLVVLSGTGSFVYAQTPDGRNRWVGALGPILGDYGSAYEIGLLGLRAAFASDWAPSRRTSLASAVPSALGLSGRRQVFRMIYVDKIGRTEIASLARVVDEQAVKGDRIATACLERAADNLADIAVEVVTELEMRDLTFPVIAVGGVAERSRIWWERVCSRLSEVAPGTRPMVSPVHQAVGAALLALRQMGLEWSPGVIRRAIETGASSRRES